MVVGITGALLGLSYQAFNSIMRGSKLKSAGWMVNNEIEFARQTALKKGTDTAVCLYSYPNVNGLGESWAIQVHRWDDEAADWSPIAQMKHLPEGVVFSDSSTYSNLVARQANQTGGTTPAMPPQFQKNGAKQTWFRYRPDGTTDLDAGTDWVALMMEGHHAASDKLPPNWIAVHLNPLSGRLHLYQP